MNTRMRRKTQFNTDHRRCSNTSTLPLEARFWEHIVRSIRLALRKRKQLAREREIRLDLTRATTCGLPRRPMQSLEAWLQKKKAAGLHMRASPLTVQARVNSLYQRGRKSKSWTTEITRKLWFSRDFSQHIDEFSVGGMQGIPKLDERVSSPLRICIDTFFFFSILLSLFCYMIFYTHHSTRPTFGPFILYDILTRLSNIHQTFVLG